MARPKAPKKHSTSKKALERASKDREAMRLRAGGMLYEDIARAIGYRNRSCAYKAVVRVLEKWQAETAEDAETVREIELHRLDEMLAGGLWEKAKAGDPQAIDRVIKIQDRRAKFLGLDAATKSELTGPGGAPLLDFSAMTLDELEAIARGVSRSDKGGG